MQKLQELLPFFAYMTAMAAIVYVLWNLALVWSTKRMTSRPAPDIANYLGAKLAAYDRQLAYFYSDHCPMCHKVSPVIDQLASAHPNVVKIDAGQHPSAARAFSVFGTPTVVLIRDEVIHKVHVGRVNKGKLLEFLAATRPVPPQ